MTHEAELRQTLNTAWLAADAILTKASTEKRGLNTEEQSAWDKASGEVVAMTKLIQELRSHEEARALLAGKEPPPIEKPDDKRNSEKELFRRFLVHGEAAFNADEVKQFRTAFPPRNSEGQMIEQRAAQVVGTNNLGGYTVPTEMYNGIAEGLKAFSGVLKAGANTLDTDGGNTLLIPTGDDTANVATLIAENTEATEETTSFSQASIGSFKYRAGPIKISTELLQDSAIDVEDYIKRKIVERFGRGFNIALTTGTGSGQPQGVVTGAALGTTTTGAAAVTSDEILNLIHSVDPAYRTNAKLMFNDSTLLAILKLKDSQNRPLFFPSYADTIGPTVHGYQFTINTAMASMAAAARFALFGDFSAFWVRRVRSLNIRRLVERYAEYDVIAYLAYWRMDSKLVDPGSGPIKYMRNA
jgi:HK97 family phage major capsid protein